MRSGYNSENALREIAGRYAEAYGEELLRELRELEARGTDSPGAKRLELRVKNRLAARNRAPYLRVAIAMAACFMLAMIPLLWRQAPVASAPSAEAAAPSDEGFAVIPLAAPLPTGFTEVGFEQDKEKSVYYLADALQDDVVMTLEATPELADTVGLVPLSLGVATAYGAAKDGYSLLTFHSEGVLYTLTCRYDINTLLRLGRGLV